MGGPVVILSVALLVSIVGIGIFIALYMRATKMLMRYSRIQDVEDYQRDCEKKAAAALAKSQQLSNESQQCQAQIAKHKQTIAHFSKVVGKFHSVSDLDKRISKRTKELDALSATLGKAKTAAEIAAQAQYFENYLAQPMPLSFFDPGLPR